MGPSRLSLRTLDLAILVRVQASQPIFVELTTAVVWVTPTFAKLPFGASIVPRG
jgi:hypothetical protein